jgi:invasion protein IalB
MSQIRPFWPFPLLLTAAALAWPASSAFAQAPAASKPATKPATTAPAAATPAPSNPVAQATLLGQFGDWGAYTATPAGKKVCFALAKPSSSSDNPPNRRTAGNAVYMFVSSRPTEKVRNEVSVLVTGYQFKPSSDASLAVGDSPFTMYTQNDGAWVKNAPEERAIIDAMRKGADVTVKATTSRGTQTTDTFSLKGIVQALDRVAQECK